MLLRIGTIAFTLPVVLLLIVYSIDLNHITDCEQMGLTYSPASGQCESGDVQLTSYYSRHTLLINLSMLVATVGTFAMIWGMVLKGMTRSQDTH